jgi:hypothetical protein
MSENIFMLINLSNHPSSIWSVDQRGTAERHYGTVEDLPFPAIDPEWTTEQVAERAEEYAVKCLEKLKKASLLNQPNAVHIMGELTFCFALVNHLKERGIVCIASTTKRNSVNLSEGKREMTFQFVKFRSYQSCPSSNSISQAQGEGAR